MAKKHATDYLKSVACLLFVTLLLLATANRSVFALGGLDNRFVRLSNSTYSATSNYAIGFDITQPTVSLGSIEIEVCSNSPLPNTVCTIPAGLNVAPANLSQTGNTGFTIQAGATANRLVLTRFSSLPSTTASVYTLSNVTNPSSTGSYYIRLRTFPTTDATGASTEDGGLAYSITSGLSINTEVPPYLRFCAGITITDFDCASINSYLMDLGTLSSSATSQSTSQMLVATNGEFGYSITMTGTTLTSGNNTIANLSSATPVNTGTSQFGINLRANSNPAIGAEPIGPGTGNISGNYASPNAFAFNNGDVVASSTNATDNRKYTLSFVVNVSPEQAPGVYATTLTFIALANF